MTIAGFKGVLIFVNLKNQVYYWIVKNFVPTFYFMQLGYLSLVFSSKRSAATTSLSEKTFHLFWFKATLSQGRLALQLNGRANFS